MIEDDPGLRELLMTMLRLEGYDAAGAGDGKEGLNAAYAQRPDAVLLDLMLPGMNGLEVLRQLREVSDVPVLVVTAKSDTVDIVLGLNCGADDYVVKPFRPKELLARLRTVIHRRRPPRQPELVYDDGLLRLDSRTGDVHVSGLTLKLTRPEFRLLELLVRSAGVAQPVNKIVADVWGEQDTSVGKIAVLVSRLRRKLDLTDLSGEVIVSARGQGYYYRPTKDLAAPETSQEDAPRSGYGHAARVLDVLNANDRQSETGDK